MSAKRKLPQKLGQPVVKQSVKVLGKGNLDESRTLVSGGGNATKISVNGLEDVVDISSDSEPDKDEISDAESVVEEASVAGEDVVMDGIETSVEPAVLEDAEEAGEPSFGDLVKANAAEMIDVAGALEDPSPQTVTYPKGAPKQPPSGASLGTVLTQALRTNDISLLESCLHTTDINTIRATIQRLDSSLAGKLLQKLAERIHKRPGRAGSLMVWVQWTLVTNGGYLATQPHLIRSLAELNKVIDERAKGLSSLLSLKGKLDMLEAQIELRRSMQTQRRLDEDEDDEGVIYVEGQESEEEGAVKAKLSNGDLRDISDVDSDVSEDMPLTNGAIADSEDEEGDSSDGEDMIDMEAEETDADSGDEEVDHDDEDSQDEDDDSDDGIKAAPPTKMPRTGLFSKKI